MNDFCKAVIEFLQAEYKDGYDFNLVVHKECSEQGEMELTVKVSPYFTIKIGSKAMLYLFSIYKHGLVNTERQSWWQEHLVGMIEGT
jgi:hypothetical protein